MTGGMAKYWIILRVGDKELPGVGHQLASCSLLNSYVLIWSLDKYTQRNNYTIIIKLFFTLNFSLVEFDSPVITLILYTKKKVEWQGYEYRKKYL